MSTAKLLNDTTANGKKFFLQFGGQGSPYLKEVSKLYKEEPLLKEFFEVAFATLSKIESDVGKSDIFYFPLPPPPDFRTPPPVNPPPVNFVPWILLLVTGLSQFLSLPSLCN